MNPHFLARRAMSKEPDGGYDRRKDEQRNYPPARTAAHVGRPARFGIDNLAGHFLRNL
jgi:hypothetical protein